MAVPATLQPGRRARRREDLRGLYLAKTARAVAYGALSAFLFLYLTADLGFSPLFGLVTTALTLVGAAAGSLVAVAPVERRLGRRRALGLFAGLFFLSSLLLFLFPQPYVVVAAVVVGGVAASSNDNGPLASLDQAILPDLVRRSSRARGFAYYNLFASFASAGGALLLAVPGALVPRSIPWLPAAPHPWIALMYVLLAGATLAGYAGLSSEVEGRGAAPTSSAAPVSPESRRHVRDLALLFGVDAFAGGLVINPLLASFFVYVWHQDAAAIGLVLFVVGTVSALSFLAASWIAERVGLLRTMVFTHLPSNVMLMLVPLMPSFALAFGMLVARAALSQMDVPTRQAYVMSLVAPSERSRAASTLSGARGLPQSVAPFPAAALQAAQAFVVPFVVGGGLKVAYDLAVWRRFRAVPLPEDPGGTSASASEARRSR